jgi:glycine/D-amino acid oxidase-like deaminating enzyme
MKFSSYWLDTAPKDCPERSTTSVEGRTQVAVIGGGLTGVVAALHLARSGAKVDLFEQNTVGFGASGRNGGMATTGMSIGIRDAVAKLGFDTAVRLYGAYTEAIDLIEKLVTEEHIDCDFARTGKLNLASKPAHYQGFEKTHELLTTRLGVETQLVPKNELRREIGSDAFHGAMVESKSAGLHVGKYIRGLGEAAQARGCDDPRAGARAEADQDRLRPRARDPSRPDACRAGPSGNGRIHPSAVPLAPGPDRSGRQLHHRHRAARRKRVR